MSARLAVIGDVHGRFDRSEARALDAMGYDGILFVGDLGSWLHTGVRRVATAIASLRTPAVVLPGNHDGPSPLGVLREAVLRGRHPTGSGARTVRRTARIARWLHPVPFAGYSLHAFGGVTVVAARPWAMDGHRLTFRRALELRHGVPSLEASAQRLCALVDATEGPLVFLAHNGPAGLGAGDDGPWALSGVDRGDADLTVAVRHAGTRAKAVVAGHMHLGGRRADALVQRGALHINGAEVPRGRRHVEVVVDALGARARWVSVPPFAP